MAKKRNTAADGEKSSSAYFRKILTEKPGLLNDRKNDRLYARWLKDHPGHDQVPKNVMQILANIKSLLRRERKSGRSKTRETLMEDGRGMPVRTARSSSKHLEHLELLLDECIMLAGKDDMESVKQQLRRVRREVIIKMGP